MIFILEKLICHKGEDKNMRENNEFSINEYVVCKDSGICQISDIQLAPLHSMPTDKLYYLLNPISNPKDTIYAPLDNNSVILRKMLTKDEALEVLDRIPYIPTIQAPNDKIRNEFYSDAMNKYDCLEWIKVIKTVYIRKEEKRLSNIEVTLAANAKKYLHAELSIVLDIPIDEVEEYIKQYVANSL